MNSIKEKRMPRKRRIYPSQSGQTLLEVAWMLPFLLLLAVGVIKIGRFAYISILVGNAAHAGAIYGAQNLTLSADGPGIKAAALNDFNDNALDTSKLALTSVTSSDAC